VFGFKLTILELPHGASHISIDDKYRSMQQHNTIIRVPL